MSRALIYPSPSETQKLNKTRRVYLTASEIFPSVSLTHLDRCSSVKALIVANNTPAARIAILSLTSILFHVRHAHQWGSIPACLHVRASGISVSRLMPRCGKITNY